MANEDCEYCEPRPNPDWRELLSDEVDSPDSWRVLSLSTGISSLPAAGCSPLPLSGSGAAVAAGVRSGECNRWRFVGGCLGVSPLSAGSGGPLRNDATVGDASSKAPCPVDEPISSGPADGERSSRRRLPALRAGVPPEEGVWVTAPRPFPLLPRGSISFRGVQSMRVVLSSPSSPMSTVGLGGSTSMSVIMLMSIITSPATDQPAMPYPPARTEGDRPCLMQNLTTALTSWASRGETRTCAEGLSFPLNVLDRSG